MDYIKYNELNMLNELKRISQKYEIRFFLGYGTALGAVREKGFIPWDTDIDVLVEYEHYEKLCRKLFEELDDKYLLNSYVFDKNYDSLKARISLKGEDHHKIHVDIFPLIGAPSNKKNQKKLVIVTYLIYRLYFFKKLKSFKLYKNQKIKLIISLIFKLILCFFPSKIFVKLFEKICEKNPTYKSNYLHNPCGTYGMKEVMPKSYMGCGVDAYFENNLFKIPELYKDYLIHLYGKDYMIPKK